MKKASLAIILIILILGIYAKFSSLASTALPPLYVEDAVNAEIQQLWSKSPTGIYAFHEAPSVNHVTEEIYYR